MNIFKLFIFFAVSINAMMPDTDDNSREGGTSSCVIEMKSNEISSSQIVVSQELASGTVSNVNISPTINPHVVLDGAASVSHNQYPYRPRFVRNQEDLSFFDKCKNTVNETLALEDLFAKLKNASEFILNSMHDFNFSSIIALLHHISVQDLHIFQHVTTGIMGLDDILNKNMLIKKFWPNLHSRYDGFKDTKAVEILLFLISNLGVIFSLYKEFFSISPTQGFGSVAMFSHGFSGLILWHFGCASLKCDKMRFISKYVQLPIISAIGMINFINNYLAFESSNYVRKVLFVIMSVLFSCNTVYSQYFFDSLRKDFDELAFYRPIVLAIKCTFYSFLGIGYFLINIINVPLSFLSIIYFN